MKSRDTHLLQIGGRDESTAGMHLVHFDEPFGERADHIRCVVQVTCLFLV